MQVPTCLPCVLSLGRASSGFDRVLRPRPLARWTAFCSLLQPPLLADSRCDTVPKTLHGTPDPAPHPHRQSKPPSEQESARSTAATRPTRTRRRSSAAPTATPSHFRRRRTPAPSASNDNRCDSRGGRPGDHRRPGCPGCGGRRGVWGCSRGRGRGAQLRVRRDRPVRCGNAITGSGLGAPARRPACGPELHWAD